MAAETERDYADSLIAGVPLPLLLVGRDEMIARLNPAAVTLFGADMAGRHVFTVLRQPNVIDCIADTFRTGTPHETRYHHKNATHETIFRVICAPVGLPTGHGRAEGVLASFEDVTPLETAGQMRRDFVATVSHELRTPLTAILGFIETLRGPARDDPEARERFLAIMAREASRMNRLVDDLLSLSRVETEERIRPTELQALPEIVLSVCHGLRPLAEESGVTLDITPAPALPLVQGDADQLRQVFTNLIENALKYGADGQRVEITCATQPRDPILGKPTVSVTVRDFGRRIDSIHLHRLTERFYRVDNHRSQKMGGTGLGLAIVKHILNRHRGRLKIESEVGKGSRFIVLLPQPGS